MSVRVRVLKHGDIDEGLMLTLCDSEGKGTWCPLHKTAWNANTACNGQWESVGCGGLRWCDCRAHSSGSTCERPWTTEDVRRVVALWKLNGSPEEAVYEV